MRSFKLVLEVLAAVLLAVFVYVFGYQPTQGGAEANNVKQSENYNEAKSQSGGKLTITMLNINHGDAILLQDGIQNIMIDVGDSRNRDLVLRKLNERGIKKINTVIISHHDNDHMGNIFAVAGKYKVSRILDNGLANEKNPISVKLHGVLSKGNYKNKVLKAGDRINFGKDMWMDVLSPGDFLDDGLRRNVNNNSVVMKLHYKEFTMMFTGDIENPTEVALSQKYGNTLKSDVLKVAHHGSRTSSNYQFISKVKPKFALISCGDYSKYHHPNKNVIGALKHLGATVYYTNANGDIVVTTDGKNFDVKAER